LRPVQAVRLLLVCLCLWLPALAGAATLSGKVVKVVDGDTIDVLQDRTTVRIRLNGIDAPERGQAFGNRAKQFVLGVAARQTVTVEIRDVDRYGRSVGDEFLPDGRNLNREIVAAGYAGWYRKYSKDQSLGRLEEEARRGRRGLWQDREPVPPWERRKAKRGGPGVGGTGTAGSRRVES
jgi:endonuclease YncB( thermonuclease family)